MSILIGGENARYLYSYTFNIENAAIYSTCDSFSVFSKCYGISSRRVSSTTEFRHNQEQQYGRLGGEKIGTLSIRFEDYRGPNIPGGLVNITSQLNISPPDGRVFEGWLLDPIFNTYNNLSLGQFLNNRLNFDQFMVNPDLYEYFVVSEEPLNDCESRISNIIAGGTRVDIVPNDAIEAEQRLVLLNFIQRVIKDRTLYFSILLSNNFMYLAWASIV
jgi:hypothetical protein